MSTNSNDVDYVYHEKEMIHEFVITRYGQTERYCFGEHTVTVNGGFPHEFTSRQLAIMRGKPAGALEAEDGKIYFVTADPDDTGSSTFIWLASRAEAVLLRRKIRFEENRIYGDM